MISKNCSKIVSILLFADDTSVLYSHSNFQILQETIQIEMNKIVDWLNLNKLSINTTKTKLILFKSPNKKKHELNFFVNNQSILQARSTTFLGVIIDEYLTWKDHINTITKKVIKSAGIVAKLRHYANKNTLKLIYYALVYPYLTYGNLLCGNTYKKRIQKLINIQKKIVRLMTFSSHLDHTEKIFQQLNILNLSKLNDYLTSLFMFRYYHLKNLPEFFANFYTSNSEIHQHYTRNSMKLHEHYQRTNYLKYSLANTGVEIWNKLDQNLKNIASYFLFKKKFKKHLVYI